MDGKIDCCISGRWWGSHCSTIDLFPVCVPKLEEVVGHQQFDGFKEHAGAVADGGAKLMGFKEGFEDLKGMLGVNVGVH